jgi:uncharacterized protein (TIGR02246 family)
VIYISDDGAVVQAGATRPQDLHVRFAEHASAGDIAALVALYEHGAILVLPGGAVVEGRAGIERVYQQMLASRPRFEITTTYARIAGDLALLANDWTMTVAAPDGAESRLAGSTAEVARRGTDGLWRYAVDDPAFAGAAVGDEGTM